MNSNGEENLRKIIYNRIKTCEDYIKTLGKIPPNKDYILEWFKVFCQHLVNIITSISDFNHKSNTELDNKEILLLYLTQILTSLSLLINCLVKECEINSVLIETRNIIRKQILLCLEGVENSLNDKQQMPSSGSFLRWMDSALDKINEINVNGDDMEEMLSKCQDARLLFEEVLAYAMSISQIALDLDGKIIKGNSQAVLESLDSLVNEINKQYPNKAMINLFIDACCDKLCGLERIVNTTVLKLCLKIFSEYTRPLELIENYCMDSKNQSETDQFDNLVIDFDLHVDRIMQIGLFAISCTTGINNTIKLRSCLASLEGLECELIPAFNALLLENSKRHIFYANLLKEHWLQQALILKQYIYLIIDPYAFCHVIYDNIKNCIDNNSDIIKRKLCLNYENIDEIVKNADVLKAFLEIILKDDTGDSQKKFKDFSDVLYEVRCASNLILIKNKPDLEGSLRIIKRCKILLTTIKRLWFGFMDELNDKSIINEDIKLDNSNIHLLDNQFMDHVIQRGKEILKERSILYKTPINAKFTPKIDKKLSKLVHIRKLCFNEPDLKNETSLDLQITDLLNEITNLSHTLN